SRICALDVGLDLGVILRRKLRSLVATVLDQHEIVHLQAFSINRAAEDMEKAEGAALGFGIIAQGTSIKRRMVRDNQDLRPLVLKFSRTFEEINQGFARQLPLFDCRRMFFEPPLIGLTP